MSENRIKVGLSAYGLSGKVFHAPFLDYLPEFDLKYIVQRSKNDALTDYPNVKILRSFEELLDSDVDLVIVNTPSYLHYEMAKQALGKGKHVVVEKPFTVTSSQAQDLIDLVKEKQLVLTVYHNKRFEGDFLTIKELLETNGVGDIKKFESKVFRNKPQVGLKKWKEGANEGGGLLYDIGSHLIDQCLQLFGSPLDVVGELKTEREGSKVVDYFNIEMKYQGFSAFIFSDFLSKPSGPLVKLEGDKGVYEKYSRDPQEQNIGNGYEDIETVGIDPVENYGVLKQDEKEPMPYPTKQGAYLLFYENLQRAILSQEELLVQPQQAKKVIEVIEQLLA